MIEVLRWCSRLVGRDGRGRWLLLVLLAIVVSGVEALGALLIFLLLGLVSGEAGAIDLPIVGNVREFLPGWDEQTLLVATAAVIGGFFVLRGGLLVVKSYVEHRVIENTGARLASRLAHTYLALPYAWHLRRNSSQLIRNAQDSVRTIVNEALRPTVKIVSEGTLAVGILTVLVIASPLATLLAFGVLAPLIGGMLKVVQPRAKRLGRANQEMAKATLQALQQSLHGVRDIKVLGRERYFHRVFHGGRLRLARARYLHQTLRTIPRAVTETTLVLFIAGFFAVTVATEGSATGALPVLGVFAYAAFRLKQPVNELTAAVNAMRFAGPALQDVEEDLAQGADAVTAAQREGERPEPLPFQRQIQLSAVRFRYEGAEDDALRDIDLTIARGDSIGLVGPTGGGKSTLADILLGLLEPTEGSVLVDGVDIRGRTRAWQRNVGMVPQSVFLVDDTIRRNIALGVPDAAIEEAQVQTVIDAAQLHDVIASLPHGLDTTVGERGVRLSGGQRQRVAITRALYHDPQVLVFDEGTSALDNQTEAALLETLSALQGERTLVTIAHRLTTVRDCDRILVVDGGRIIDTGTYEELHHRSAAFQGLQQPGLGVAQG
jgi:ATP-binding cassette subfamily C protein